MASTQPIAAIVFGCLFHGRWGSCEILNPANWWHLYGHSLRDDGINADIVVTA